MDQPASPSRPASPAQPVGARGAWLVDPQKIIMCIFLRRAAAAVAGLAGTPSHVPLRMPIWELDLDDGECFVDILEKSGTYGLGWAGLGWAGWLG